MIEYKTIRDELITDIIFKHYGTVLGIIDKVIEANHHLLMDDIFIKKDTTVYLPEITPKKEIKVIRLWD